MIWLSLTFLITLIKISYTPSFLMLLYSQIWMSLTYLPIWMSAPSFISGNMSTDPLSVFLIILTLLITYLMLIPSLANMEEMPSFYYSVIFILTLILITSFFTMNLLWFYFMFESSLLPIFTLVMSFGYQPERLMAGLSLLFYTITASLPLLLMLLFWKSHNMSMSFSMMYSSNLNSLEKTFFSNMILLPSCLAFLVKFPLYGTHQWLPKAHVEAPVAGSMMLAAVLLKLGGYGLIRLSVMTQTSSFLKLILSFYSLLGGSCISFLCVRQTDMKILIAYSSVAHMSMVISAYLMMNSWGWMGGLMVMISHGVCSSGLFMMANMFYKRSGSRSMILMKGVLSAIPLLSLWWFLLCLSNMGGPPSLNLLAEIFSIISLINFNYMFMIPFSLMLLLATSFSLILYSLTQQGLPSKKVMWNSPMQFSELNNCLNHSTIPFILSILLFSLN